MFARPLRLATVALALGIVTGTLALALRAAAFVSLRDVLWPLTATSLERGVAGSALAVVLWLLLARLLRPLLDARIATSLATAATLVPLAAWFALGVNRAYLPGKFEPVSLAANAALALVFLWIAVFVNDRLRDASDAPPRASLLALGVPPLALALVPLAAHFVGHRGRSDGEPDVLVILLDVLRADHLGVYGYVRDTSPNLDAFAQDSIVFDDFVAASTYTKSSVASLFTGLTAFHHGVYEGTFGADPTKVQSDVLPARVTTLAERLFDSGWNTAAWVENGQIRAYMGYDQGFSLYHDQPGHMPVIAHGFREWLAEWGDVERWFAYLHVLDLHAPYTPEPPFRGRYGREASAASRMDYHSWRAFKNDVIKGRIQLTAAERDQLEAEYDEEIAYVDDQVGRILAHLKATGRYDDTLIVVTSDHGEGFLEHGFISHSNDPFEELVHVPLIVKMPRSSGRGRRVKQMVAHVDLAPTLLDFAGVAPIERVDGQSFLPLLLDPANARIEPRWRYIEYLDIVGVRNERWKYIDRPLTEPRLFDLTADSAERVNCIADHPDVARAFAAAVAAAQKARRNRGESERVTVDQETIRALEAMGYM